MWEYDGCCVLYCSVEHSQESGLPGGLRPLHLWIAQWIDWTLQEGPPSVKLLHLTIPTKSQLFGAASSGIPHIWWYTPWKTLGFNHRFPIKPSMKPWKFMEIPDVFPWVPRVQGPRPLWSQVPLSFAWTRWPYTASWMLLRPRRSGKWPAACWWNCHGGGSWWQMAVEFAIFSQPKIDFYPINPNRKLGIVGKDLGLL